MPGVVVVEPEPEVLPPVVVLGVLPAVPVVPPLPTEPLELPPRPVLAPVPVELPELLPPIEERCSRMHLSRSMPVRWSQLAALGVLVAPLLLVLGELVLLELLVSVLLELLGVLVLLGVLLLPVLLPALVLPEAASLMHFSFSAPLRSSQRLVEEPTLLLGLPLVLPLLLPDVWANDAPEIPSSAAATAAQSVFIFI